MRTAEGWRDAQLIKAGGQLDLKGSTDERPKRAEVVKVEHELKHERVYNLEVANAHTFFVGEEGVWGHNAKKRCAPPPAPGRPTPQNTGGNFVPGKGSGHYRCYAGVGHGWCDKYGNIWIPTGSGSLAHGGAHWDVQHPRGHGYCNVYPGGRVRGGWGGFPK